EVVCACTGGAATLNPAQARDSTKRAFFISGCSFWKRETSRGRRLPGGQAAPPRGGQQETGQEWGRLHLDLGGGHLAHPARLARAVAGDVNAPAHLELAHGVVRVALPDARPAAHRAQEGALALLVDGDAAARLRADQSLDLDVVAGHAAGGRRAVPAVVRLVALQHDLG